jgi:hypothetical protein
MDPDQRGWEVARFSCGSAAMTTSTPILCRQCATGWVPGTPKTFNPKCHGCKKKLENGQRTGLEPLGADCGPKRYRSNKADQAKYDAAAKARAAAFGEGPR